MGLAAVMIEEHARAAVQLRDDDSFGAVDDERAVLGHEGQLAQIHFLLAHVLDRLLRAAGFLVEHHQPHLHAQRRRIRQTAQLAFLHVEHRLAQTIAHVLERGVPGIARNGEHAVERRMQSDCIALRFRDVRLQESPIRVQLDRQQVRRAEDARTLAKVLADALLFGERISHVRAFPAPLGAKINQNFLGRGRIGPVENGAKRLKNALANTRRISRGQIGPVSPARERLKRQ
jgi:hypothetical protein